MTKPTNTTRRRPPTPAKPRRLSAVLRVSRRNGRGGDGFMSPDQQRDAIDAWAKSHGVEIRPEWVHDETDSVSGRTTQRAGLQAAMAQAMSGETDGVIVARVDRFSRNLIEGLTSVRELHDAGKVFVAVKDGIDGSNPRDPGTQVQLMMMMLFAEWYLESVTAGWADTQQRRIAKGVAGIPPYGYTRASKEDGRHLVPDKAQAKVVQRIFADRAGGKSLQTIANELNTKGIAPPQRAPRRDGKANRDAAQWVVMHITRITGNRVYLGELSHGEVVNAAAHKPLVGVEVFDAANNVRKTPARRTEGTFLLAGMVRCASCGARMSGAHSHRNFERGGKTFTYRYYRCRVNYRWGTCTAPARINADVLEPLVVADYLAGLKKQPDRVEGVEGTDALDAARAELEAARGELRRYQTDTVSTRLATLDPESYEAGQNARLDAMEDAQRALEAARTAVRLPDVPDDLAETWDDKSTEQQRSYLADTYAVIAVAKAAGTKRTAADPVKLWAHGAAGCPTGLPGVDGGDKVTPIPLGSDTAKPQTKR